MWCEATDLTGVHIQLSMPALHGGQPRVWIQNYAHSPNETKIKISKQKRKKKERKRNKKKKHHGPNSECLGSCVHGVLLWRFCVGMVAYNIFLGNFA